MRGLKLFWRDESGSTAVEYGLLIAIIAVTMVAALGNYYGAMNNMFTRITDAMNEPAK